MATLKEIQFWLEYRKDKTLTKDSFTDEASMKTALKNLIKSGIKPKIIDLSKQQQKTQLAS